MAKIAKEVRAQYQAITVPSAYVGNPLIEALPPIFSEAEVYRILKHYPKVDLAAEQAAPVHERVHCVSALDDLVIPLPIAYDVETALSILIRRGYAPRNPFSREWRHQGFGIREAMADPLADYEIRSKSVPAMMVTGVSGSGKTTLLETLLGAYPQTIVHTEYHGQRFNTKQLVWIEVNASFDASLKGLILAMFGEVDTALGTNYRQQFDRSKRTIDTLIGNLAQVFTTHQLGVLYVDEIQCLLLRGMDEAKLALSLFLKIANVCKVPMVFSCTYAAASLFAKVARNARRVCSGGYFDLALPRTYKEEVWDKLVLEAVWKKYQWVPEPAPLDDDLRELYFQLTQGILAVFIALHRASQIYAIRRKLPSVDAAILQKVYETQFVLLHPALEALRSGQQNRLEKFEDLLPPKDQLAQLLRPSAAEIAAERLKRLIELSQGESAGPNTEDSASAAAPETKPPSITPVEATKTSEGAPPASPRRKRKTATTEESERRKRLGLDGGNATAT